MKQLSQSSGAIIRQCGVLARSCLESARGGKVLAAFSRATYLLTDENELFWIARQDAPMHRRCMTLEAPVPDVPVGSHFRVENQQLRIGSLAFSWEGASVWNALAPNPAEVSELSALPGRFHSLFSRMDISEARGFGNFIPHIVSLSENPSAPPVLKRDDPVLLRAEPFVLDMARACLERGAARINQNAAALIGVGSGLTPSGDDFLGGLFFAVRLLDTVYPESRIIDLLPDTGAYCSRTHLISYTLLEDHARGHAAAPLHQIANGLLGRGSPESIFPYVRQLAQLGHSTGWDVLAGFLTGMLVTVPATEAPVRKTGDRRTANLKGLGEFPDL